MGGSSIHLGVHVKCSWIVVISEAGLVSLISQLAVLRDDSHDIGSYFFARDQTDILVLPIAGKLIVPVLQMAN